MSGGMFPPLIQAVAAFKGAAEQIKKEFEFDDRTVSVIMLGAACKLAVAAIGEAETLEVVNETLAGLKPRPKTFEEKMGTLAMKLSNVARCADAFWRWSDHPEVMDSADIIAAACAHDPEHLLGGFEDYALLVRTEGRNSSVLVATKDRSRGLIEAAGCSASGFAHLWRQPNAPCEFTLDLSKVCK